jgi:hypothetical protein
MSDEPAQVSEAPAEAPPAAPPLPAVTSAAEWRRRANGRWLLTLPMGTVVKVRSRPDIVRAVEDGTIAQDELVPTGAPRTLADSVSAARRWLPYIVVEPPMMLGDGSPPPEDVMLVEDVADFEALLITGWAMGTLDETRRAMLNPIEVAA